MLDNPEITAAWVQGICGIVGAVAAGAAAGWIGKRFISQQRIRSDLQAAIKDIEFLLAVEERHCELHRDAGGSSLKNTVRKKVRQNTGLAWSKRFTPGRVEYSDGTVSE